MYAFLETMALPKIILREKEVQPRPWTPTARKDWAGGSWPTPLQGSLLFPVPGFVRIGEPIITRKPVPQLFPIGKNWLEFS